VRSAGSQVPFRLIDDRAEAPLATQLENLAELRVHLVALRLGQVKSRNEQLVGLGLLHRGEIQVAEQPARLEIAHEQRTRHLPKKSLVE